MLNPASEHESKMLTSHTDSCSSIFLYSYTESMAWPPLWDSVSALVSLTCALLTLLVSLLRVSHAPLSLCFPCVLSVFILDCAMLLLPLLNLFTVFGFYPCLLPCELIICLLNHCTLLPAFRFKPPFPASLTLEGCCSFVCIVSPSSWGFDFFLLLFSTV